MEDIVVLYPIMGRGHLIPMVKLGKLMLSHCASLSINVLLPSPPNSSTANYIATVSSSLTIHHLPDIPLAHQSRRLLLSNTNLLHALHSISPSSKQIKAFVLDFFNFSAAEVPSALGIPTYYFFPTAASSLAFFLHLPTIHQNASKSFNDADYVSLNVPGLPPITEEDMPDPIRERRSWRYEFFLNMSIYLRKNDGIIVNSFENLEMRALKALTEGLCVPEGPTPPVFCIGPLVSISSRDGEGDDHGCLSWLDSQPSQSVVFLSFGSQGRLSASLSEGSPYCVREKWREILVGG